VTVPYGADTELIRKLLVDCAHANPKVLTDPPPYVLFTDFGPNAMIFHLRFWIMNVVLSRDRIRSEIRFAVEKVFREHGIEIGEGDVCGCSAGGKYHCQTAIAAPGPPVDPQTSR
jgi:small-conductance mechanosensitive channel